MRTKTLLFAAAGALMLLLAGCGGKILYSHYYTLEIIPPPAAEVHDARFNGTLAVRRFEIAPYLRQGGIAYRQSPEEVEFYDYHRWAASPSETVTSAVIDAFRASGMFSVVKRYDGQNQQDYLLIGRLERLDEIDYGGSVQVLAKVSAELADLHSGITVWTGEANDTLKVEPRDVHAVVTTMSQAIQQTIAGLIARLDRQLAKN